MERIGIYGGSFDPPHVGHIRAAIFARKAFALDKLLLIASNRSCHKKQPEDAPTPQQRLDMLCLAAEDQEGLQVCDIELQRGGISYTWQTVQALTEQYPEAQLYLLVGTDMFLSFHTWKHPERILHSATLVVLERELRCEPQLMEQKALLEEMGGTVLFAENPVTQISSTDLRRLIAFGCTAPFLPQAVSEYIQRHGLYGVGLDRRQLPMDQLMTTVCSLLKPERVAHVLGCMETAQELARIWGADPVDAARAGLLHDITKALDGPLQLTLCEEYGVALDEFSRNNPKTLHALTGSLVAQRIFGEDPGVVSAIRSHTTGKANMNTLEKIIYVADYMEPNRNFPGVEVLRELAYKDLDRALRLGLEMTIALLIEQKRTISPESQQALEWLNNQV